MYVNICQYHRQMDRQIYQKYGSKPQKKKFKKSWNKAELLLENKNIMAVDRVMLKINELKVGVTLNRNKRYMWGSIYK